MISQRCQECLCWKDRNPQLKNWKRQLSASEEVLNMGRTKKFQWWWKTFQKLSLVLLTNGTKQKDLQTFTVWEISTAWSNTFWGLANKDKSTLMMTMNWSICLSKLYSGIYTAWMVVLKFLWDNIAPGWAKVEMRRHWTASSA